jgi:hypothetical protein
MIFDEENMTWTLERLERSSLGDNCCIRWTLGRATLGNSYRVRLSSHLIGQREIGQRELAWFGRRSQNRTSEARTT